MSEMEENEFLNCPVCLNFYTSYKQPIKLDCTHTICSKCLPHLQSKSCPLCRHRFHSLDDDLLPNFEMIAELETTTIYNCPKIIKEQTDEYQSFLVKFEEEHHYPHELVSSRLSRWQLPNRFRLRIYKMIHISRNVYSYAYDNEEMEFIIKTNKVYILPELYIKLKLNNTFQHVSRAEYLLSLKDSLFQDSYCFDNVFEEVFAYIDQTNLDEIYLDLPLIQLPDLHVPLIENIPNNKIKRKQYKKKEYEQKEKQERLSYIKFVNRQLNRQKHISQQGKSFKRISKLRY